MTNTHPVLFVGAGPGAPDLITVRGQRALARADLVVYAGSLVPEAVLVWARDQAQRISSAAMDLGQIIQTMATAHQAGQRVVRLHTGEPSLYGAVHEQMAELRRRNIPYRIIPGVTAAFAAAAALGMEYTLPQKTQTLILTRMAGRTPVPETESLESLARHGASLAIYLSLGLVEKVAAALEAGYGADAPCALAFKVSHPEEKIVRTTVADLAETARKEGFTRHGLIIVGPSLRAPDRGRHHESKLYDRTFSHGYRKGEEDS